MCEYLPIEPESCSLCAEQNGDTTTRVIPFKFVTPKIAILTLVLILNHDIERDRHKPGFWHDYNEEDMEEDCPLCREILQRGQMVVETSCLHRYHYDCIMHFIICHKGRFCCDKKCGMRIF